MFVLDHSPRSSGLRSLRYCTTNRCTGTRTTGNNSDGHRSRVSATGGIPLGSLRPPRLPWPSRVPRPRLWSRLRPRLRPRLRGLRGLRGLQERVGLGTLNSKRLYNSIPVQLYDI